MNCHKCGHSIDEHRVNVKKIGCHHTPCECELRPSEIVGDDYLVYLQACARAVEDLSSIDATDATIAMFFKRDAKKLAKLKRTK